MPRAFAPLFAVALMLACGNADAKKKPAAPAPASPSACEDFYTYVNDAWLRAHPLPAGAESFSRWDELSALADTQTRQLLGNSRAGSGGAASGLLADLVASGQQTDRLDASVKTAAQPLLVQIDAMRKPKDIARVIAALHAAGVPVLFDFDVLREPGSGQPQATFIAAGLGLPEPAFYNSEQSELQRVGGLYRAYLADLLALAGAPGKQLTDQSAWAIAIEQALAKASIAESAQTLDTAQADKAYPALRLSEYLQKRGVAPKRISLRNPEFFKTVDRMLAKTPVAHWQAYLRTQLMNSLAPALGKDLRQPYLAVFNDLDPDSAGAGTSVRITGLIGQEGADLLGAAYAETYLDRLAAEKARAIGEAVRATMARAIDRADWLDTEGKATAQRKLAAMRLEIGQTSEPPTFAGLSFDRGNFAGNLLALRRWNNARALARLDRPAWPWPVSQTQPLIGYQATENRVIATAAALRAPALEGKSDAADFGSFGALIGQQMSLAFADSQGADGRSFVQRQPGLVAQYNAYPAAGNRKVDGLRTQRQNAADLAGLELAWDAYSAGPADAAGKKDFFTAWAALWARQERASAAPAESDFAPARWRSNGPLSNLPAFAATFACKAKQAMFKPEKEQYALWR